MKVTVKDIESGRITVLNHTGMEAPYVASQIANFKENGYEVLSQIKL